MNPELLVTLGKIAGIAGIAVGGLVLIFRSVIHENFLSKMTQEQSFKITKSIISIAGLIALCGILAWVYLKASGADTDKTKLVVKGVVHNFENSNIQNIKVTIKSGTQNIGDGITDSEGNFRVIIHGTGNADAVIEVTGAGYFPYTKNVELNFADESKDIGEIKIKKQDGDQATPIVNAPSQASPNSIANNQVGILQTGDNFSSQTDNNFIVINTNEYSTLLSNFGAAAGATLTVGGMSYELGNTDITIPFSQAGMIDYQIVGYTMMGGQTTCNNNSIGKIELAAGAKYYLFENLNNTATTDCNWYLFNEYQFSQQKTVLQQKITQAFQ